MEHFSNNAEKLCNILHCYKNDIKFQVGIANADVLSIRPLEKNISDFF